jgi:hypothetical protein
MFGDTVNRISHHITASNELVGGDPLGYDVTHRVVPVGHECRDDGRFDTAAVGCGPASE